MSAVALAVIGKNNVPLYIKTFCDEADEPSDEELFGLPATKTQRSLRQQFILHSALDRFEKLSGPYPGCAWREYYPESTIGNDAMFVGLLCPVEDLRVYGYMTTTQIKFLLTVQDDAALGDQRTIDETIKHLFIKIHRQYVEYSLNPFSSMTGPISSARFEQKVSEWVSAYNRAVS